MKRTILVCNNPRLENVYKDDERIKVIELKDELLQDLYGTNDYKIIIKENMNECELLSGKKSNNANESYKWAIKVNSGELKEFKEVLQNRETKIIED